MLSLSPLAYGGLCFALSLPYLARLYYIKYINNINIYIYIYIYIYAASYSPSS